MTGVQTCALPICGKWVTLEEQRGKWLVLYFYPKDNTPGCTTEACQFRDDIYRIRELQAEVIGVSVDNTESHAKFAEKHGLPFPLLSDGDGTVAQSYGALFGLGPIKLAKRHTFIVNPEGRIAKIYREVNPADHSAEIIRDLETLQQSGNPGTVYLFNSEHSFQVCVLSPPLSAKSPWRAMKRK